MSVSSKRHPGFCAVSACDRVSAFSPSEGRKTQLIHKQIVPVEVCGGKGDRILESFCKKVIALFETVLQPPSSELIVRKLPLVDSEREGFRGDVAERLENSFAYVGMGWGPGVWDRGRGEGWGVSRMDTDVEGQLTK